MERIDLLKIDVEGAELVRGTSTLVRSDATEVSSSPVWTGEISRSMSLATVGAWLAVECALLHE